MKRKVCKIATCPFGKQGSWNVDEIKRQNEEAQIQEHVTKNEALKAQFDDLTNVIEALQKNLADMKEENQHLAKNKSIVIVPPPQQPCEPFSSIEPPCLTSLQPIREAYSTSKVKYDRAVKKIANLMSENTSLESNLGELTMKKVNLTEKLAALQKREEELALGDGNEDKCQIQLKVECETILCRKNAAEEEILELKSGFHEQLCQLDEYKQKYKKHHVDIESTQRESIVLENEIVRFREVGEKELQDLNEIFNRNIDELNPIYEAIEKVKKKLEMVVEKKNEAQQEKDKIEANLIDFCKKIEELKCKLEKLQNQPPSEDPNKHLTLDELEQINEKLKQDTQALWQLSDENQEKLTNINNKIRDVQEHLEKVRSDAADIISKVDERANIIRKNLQNRIFDLERDLCLNKVYIRGAENAKDEMRCKLQAEMSELTEKFSAATDRVRNLETYIAYFKKSYLRNLLPIDFGKKKVPQYGPECFY